MSLVLPPHATRVFVVKGKQRLQRTVYEAETAFLTDYQELRNNQAVLSGVYEEDNRCSGGVKASWLGGRASNDLIWHDVHIMEDGRYLLHISAMTDETRTLTIDINGQNAGTLEYKKNGEKAISVNLKRENNVVRLWNKESRMPDIDYMRISRDD